MKKKVLFLFIVIVICIFIFGGISVSAETYGDLTYYVSYEQVVVSGCSSSAITVEIPNQIDGYPVTAISSHAFSNCGELESITIGENVTFILDYAFSGCNKLTSIYWNAKNVDDFTSTNLVFGYTGENGEGVSVIFSDSVEKIPAYIFCSSNASAAPKITSVTIGKNVTSIGDSAFKNCSLLKSIYVPENVISIGCSVFEGCSSLEEITLPFIGSARGNSGTIDSVFGYIFGYETSSASAVNTDIKQSYTSTSYAYYHIPSSVKKVTITDESFVGYGAFSGCSSISDIIIDCQVKAIGSHAFSYHYNLLNVVIKSATTKFADDLVFYETDFATLYGYSNSTTKDYATKYNIPFEDIVQSDNCQINGSIMVINNTIVVSVELSGIVTDEYLHIALYKDSGQMVDYIIVPANKLYNNMNVVFKDSSNSSYAKVFLWSSLENIQPLTEAKKIDIVY